MTDQPTPTQTTGAAPPTPRYLSKAQWAALLARYPNFPAGDFPRYSIRYTPPTATDPLPRLYHVPLIARRRRPTRAHARLVPGLPAPFLAFSRHAAQAVHAATLPRGRPRKQPTPENL